MPQQTLKGALTGLATRRAPAEAEATLARVPDFKTADLYRPTGDQPQAIATLSEGLLAGDRFQTLLGATGTGKTAAMAWIVEQVRRPALVIAHNKTLAAQLCNEFRVLPHERGGVFRLLLRLLPAGGVRSPGGPVHREGFVPERRHLAPAAGRHLRVTRRDVVVVASVSCIYGLGSPEEWRERVLILTVGEEHERDGVLRKLIDSQYVRNDSVLGVAASA